MMFARSRFEENHAGLAEDLLEQVPAQFRFTGWGLLKNYVAGSLYTLRGHTDWVNTLAWSPDGKCIASGGYDNTIQVWRTT